MKKFWRSGMIDKKVVAKREQEEYINKLERTILELRRDDVGDLINDTTDYDEIGIGDNVVLDFKDGCIVVGRKDSVKDSPTFKFHEWIRNRKPYDRYDADVAFDKKHFEIMRRIDHERKCRSCC